jgi:hypothetical protein
MCDRGGGSIISITARLPLRDGVDGLRDRACRLRFLLWNLSISSGGANGGGVLVCEPPDGGVGLSMHIRSRSRSLSDSSALPRGVGGRKDVTSGLRASERCPRREERRVRMARKGDIGTSPPGKNEDGDDGRAKSADEVVSEGREEVDIVALDVEVNGQSGSAKGPL